MPSLYFSPFQCFDAEEDKALGNDTATKQKESGFLSCFVEESLTLNYRFWKEINFYVLSASVYFFEGCLLLAASIIQINIFSYNYNHNEKSGFL